MEQCGAWAYEPFLVEERALALGDHEELQRAHTLFAGMGAEGHVLRLDARLVDG
jgi:hypothetical protein